MRYPCSNKESGKNRFIISNISMIYTCLILEDVIGNDGNNMYKVVYSVLPTART